jgi:hypothetical protein
MREENKNINTLARIEINISKDPVLSDIYIIIWSGPDNMPKYYQGLRDILPDRSKLIHLIFLIQNVPYDVEVMVFKASFNNISAISWRSDILMDDNEAPGENH